MYSTFTVLYLAHRFAENERHVGRVRDLLSGFIDNRQNRIDIAPCYASCPGCGTVHFCFLAEQWERQSVQVAATFEHSGTTANG